MTDAPQPELSEEQLAELERLLAKCVPQNIDTAEYKDDGLYECPACSGDGEVEGRVYTNYDNQPNGVQFFGIGHAPLDAEALFRKAIAALPALLAMARRSVPGDVRGKALEEAAADDVYAALRPIRGCATDEQYCDVLDRVTSLVSRARAKALEEAAMVAAKVMEEWDYRGDPVDEVSAMILALKDNPVR